MEQAYEAKGLRGLIKRMEALLVGDEALHGLLELQTQEIQQATAVNLFDTPMNVPQRIHGPESEEDVRMRPDGACDGVVRAGRQPRIRASVFPKQYGRHLPVSIHLRGRVDRHVRYRIVH